MQKERLLHLSSKSHEGKSILYVMSRDQRVEDNFALLAAQKQALNTGLPLVVLFNLLPELGVRAREHFAFMIDGLEEVAAGLERHNIRFVIKYGDPVANIVSTCEQLDAVSVYFDFSPLKGPRQTAKEVAKRVKCSVVVVDTHNIIPAWIATDKQEFAAHTFRPKVHKLLEHYLVEPDTVVDHPQTLNIPLEGISFAEARRHIESIPARGLQLSMSAGPAAARNHLTDFIQNRLSNYATGRNDAAMDLQSGLSPYLHFGHIASLRVALEVLYSVNERPLLFDQAKMAQSGDTPTAYDGMNALFEEMIVRKELSDNFCLYGSGYTQLSHAPAWSQQTLSDHRSDPREHIYTLQSLEQAGTHDAAWNAAQNQLRHSGKMHGYMRMYWAKKILEWTKTPEQAIEYAIYLNDAYSIDGGDPNGYVGVLWSIAGVHDRPWTERPVFGKIRYMNAAGLKRKFNIEAYIHTWNEQ